MRTHEASTRTLPGKLSIIGFGGTVVKDTTTTEAADSCPACSDF